MSKNMSPEKFGASVTALGVIGNLAPKLRASTARHGGNFDEALIRLNTDDGAQDRIGRELAALCAKPAETPKSVEPLYLADTNTRHGMSGGDDFDVEAWVKSLKKYGQGSNFQSLTTGRIEKGVPAGTLRHFRNARGGNGTEIVKEGKAVHGGKASCFRDIKDFIESGAAKKDGTWYVFLLEIDGVEWLVNFRWFDDLVGSGWDLGTFRPEVDRFSTADEFLFRDSAA